MAAAGGSRRVTASMMKFKPNQTRTYDREGYKKRAACLCFRSEREDEVSPPSCRARGAGDAGPGPGGAPVPPSPAGPAAPLCLTGGRGPRPAHTPLHAPSRAGAPLPCAACGPGEGAWSCAGPRSLKRRRAAPPVWAGPGAAAPRRASRPPSWGGAAGRGPTCAAAPSFVRGGGRRPSAGGRGAAPGAGAGTDRLELPGYPLRARDGQKVG